MAVYVSVCGRVESVAVLEMSLDGLCTAVAQRFDIGDRLRFISDEEGEPEVANDDHLKRLVQQRQTLRVLISDSALSDLEQRMWQLRQLQWGFFQDELTRSKNQANAVRSEVRQLRQVVEQCARREVEITNELLGERQARERLEAQMAERHETVVQELRREQRARDTAEAALRKELEDARQTALKYAAASDRAIQEVKGSLGEETRNRGKNIEALLSEWATSQAEVRQAMEAVRGDVDTGKQESDRTAKDVLRETSARQAFEQFFGEKVRVVEGALGKVEGNTSELEQRLCGMVQESSNSQTIQVQQESIHRAAHDKEIMEKLSDLDRRVVQVLRRGEQSPLRRVEATPTSPGGRAPASPTQLMVHSWSQPVAIPTLSPGTMVLSQPGSIQVPNGRSVSPSPASVTRLNAVQTSSGIITPPPPQAGPPTVVPINTVMTRPGSQGSIRMGSYGSAHLPVGSHIPIGNKR